MPSAQGDLNPFPTVHKLQGTQADFASFEISFSPHVSQASKPPVLNSPLSQGSQTVSMPSAQGDLNPSPTVHKLQGTQADFASFDTEFVGHG
jgi:hypothetical protein